MSLTNGLQPAPPPPLLKYDGRPQELPDNQGTALPALEQLPPLPAPCTRLEVDLYRLLRCCERIARSQSAVELQRDFKFHNYVAYLRELFAQVQQESRADSAGRSASLPVSAAAQAQAARAEAYLQRITLLADLLEEHVLPDMWHMPDSLPLQDVCQLDALVPQDPNLPSTSRGIRPAQPQQQLQQLQGETNGGALWGCVPSSAAFAGRQGREALGLRSRRRLLRDRRGPSSRNRQSGSSLPGSSLDDASRAIITTHKNLQEELSDQMLTLAGQMKANSLAMEEKVKSSNKVTRCRHVVHVVARSCRHLSASERFTFSWWAVTGAIHMLMEGAFVAFPALISSTSKAFLLDAWKEYAISDSRYATRDTCIVSLEAVTAFIEGPACILILYAMAARKPFSNLLQFTVSLGQLYGAAVYFATSYLEGFPHSDPHPIYFWGYFVGMNAIWILVPFLILWRCWARIISAEASIQAPGTRRSKRD
ncbi:unnamed protein product [Closterium sp. Naga37s-1]|nr:unnamed protein product [Closterium sp. Naga37s-1]